MSVRKQEREKIIQLFSESYLLRFSEIEKAMNIRSNMVAYHLERLQKEGLIAKQGQKYTLTMQGEKCLPVLSSQEQAPLPVILIAPMRRGKVFLAKRTKRPYKGYLGLIGGKMRFGETLEHACARKLQEHDIHGTMIACNAIAQEHIEEEGVKHSFLLLFVTATCDKEGLHNVKKLKDMQVIPSDLWLLEHKLKSRVDIPQFSLYERNGTVSAFRVR